MYQIQPFPWFIFPSDAGGLKKTRSQHPVDKQAAFLNPPACNKLTGTTWSAPVAVFIQ